VIKVEIPGRGALELAHAVFDVNGTLALDGVLLLDVAERIAALQEHVQVHLLTADTHGKQAAVDEALGLKATKVRSGVEKLVHVLSLGADHVVAVGNGANDVNMFQAAALSIAVLGPEGVSFEAVKSADVLVASIYDALDLLLNTRRLIATMRR
jgi:soluble P-type ATPase